MGPNRETNPSQGPPVIVTKYRCQPNSPPPIDTAARLAIILVNAPLLTAGPLRREGNRTWNRLTTLRDLATGYGSMMRAGAGTVRLCRGLSRLATGARSTRLLRARSGDWIGQREVFVLPRRRPRCHRVPLRRAHDRLRSVHARILDVASATHQQAPTRQEVARAELLRRRCEMEIAKSRPGTHSQGGLTSGLGW